MDFAGQTSSRGLGVQFKRTEDQRVTNTTLASEIAPIFTAALAETSFRSDEGSDIFLQRATNLRTSSMFGLVPVLFALFSASIFLAHAVDAYQVR